MPKLTTYGPTPARRTQVLDADERHLSALIRSALAASGVDVDHVEVEVDRDQVTIRGEVRDRAALARISEVIRAIDGVDELVDQLVITTS